jgi:hypothetical protein
MAKKVVKKKMKSKASAKCSCGSGMKASDCCS